MNTYYLFSGQLLEPSESSLSIPAKIGANVEIWIYNRFGCLIFHIVERCLSDKCVCFCEGQNWKEVASIAVVSIDKVNYVYKIKKG